MRRVYPRQASPPNQPLQRPDTLAVRSTVGQSRDGRGTLAASVRRSPLNGKTLGGDRYRKSTGTILGVLWAAWHLPLFLVSGWAGLPFPVYVLLVVALGFIVNFAFNVSRASIGVAIVTHAVFNASSAIMGRVFTGTAVRVRMSPSVVLVCSFVLVATVVTLVTRGRLGHIRPA